MRIYLRQRLLRRHNPNQPVRHAETRQDADGGDVMTRTFKALSVLLTYPTAELQKAVPEIAAAMDREALLPVAARRQLDLLLSEITIGDLYDLQERYVL